MIFIPKEVGDSEKKINELLTLSQYCEGTTREEYTKEFLNRLSGVDSLTYLEFSKCFIQWVCTNRPIVILDFYFYGGFKPLTTKNTTL